MNKTLVAVGAAGLLFVVSSYFRVTLLLRGIRAGVVSSTNELYFQGKLNMLAVELVRQTTEINIFVGLTHLTLIAICIALILKGVTQGARLQ